MLVVSHLNKACTAEPDCRDLLRSTTIMARMLVCSRVALELTHHEYQGLYSHHGGEAEVDLVVHGESIFKEAPRSVMGCAVSSCSGEVDTATASPYHIPQSIPCAIVWCSATVVVMKTGLESGLFNDPEGHLGSIFKVSLVT